VVNNLSLRYRDESQEIQRESVEKAPTNVMSHLFQKAIQVSLCLVLLVSCSTERADVESLSGDYPIQPVSFTHVNFQDDFWAPRLQTHREVTLPYTLEQIEETGRVLNFEIAAGLKIGSFCTIYPFDDSDVFKILEGAAYALHVQPDPVLAATVDTLIAKIAAAQEEDGYLYTNRTINPDSTHEWVGEERWQYTHDLSHELYNVGHLYEAAAAHYWATGKRTLLDVALKNADLVDRDFGWGKIERPPGHQVIEIGLAKLYRITGDERYIRLAQFFLDVRGPDQGEYSQAHKKVTDQTEAVGHAVRAVYLYSGMADIAALTGNRDYINAIDRIWENVVSKKIYVTGGIGSTGSHEGFGPDYYLPNAVAYNETCASVANVFWNHRLFLLHGHARYIDVLERTLYNALHSGLSLTGDRFFYPNPLESQKNHERSPWFNCACCPSNMARFLPSIPGYQYARRGNSVYVNLFIGGEADIVLDNGPVHLVQNTRYPLDGRVLIEVEPEDPETFDVMVRIPGWARNEPVPSDLYTFQTHDEEPVVLRVNGEQVPVTLEDGYAKLARSWQSGDTIELILPMPARRIEAHEAVEDDRGKVAFQRGPLVFCAEGKDQMDERVIHFMVPDESPITIAFEPDLLQGVQTLGFDGFFVNRTGVAEETTAEPIRITAIPYYAWANRGRDFMTVWFPRDEGHARPSPGPTIAYRSHISASGDIIGLEALSDQFVPEHTNDRTNPIIHWWPRFGQREWVQYDFAAPEQVSSSTVYWFDDRPDGGCRLPLSWTLSYKEGNTWKPVTPLTPYTVTRNEFNFVSFEPVTTSALRLELQSEEEFSSGIHEWSVE